MRVNNILSLMTLDEKIAALSTDPSVPRLGMAGSEVRNSGSRAGDEVVQMYVAHMGSKIERAQEDLRGFQRISLAPGTKVTVKFTLRAAAPSYWNSERATWDIEANHVDVRLGSSSADIKLRSTVRIRSTGE